MSFLLYQHLLGCYISTYWGRLGCWECSASQTPPQKQHWFDCWDYFFFRKVKGNLLFGESSETNKTENNNCNWMENPFGNWKCADMQLCYAVMHCKLSYYWSMSVPNLEPFHAFLKRVHSSSNLWQDWFRSKDQNTKIKIRKLVTGLAKQPWQLKLFP